MPENSIRRRVVLKESGAGIPDLVVTTQDIESEGAPVTEAEPESTRDAARIYKPDPRDWSVADPDVDLRKRVDEPENPS